MVLGGRPFPREVYVMGRKGPLPPFPPRPSASTSPWARSEAVWLAQTSRAFPTTVDLVPPILTSITCRAGLG